MPQMIWDIITVNYVPICAVYLELPRFMDL
jgi:hypothetical protein